MPPKIAVVTGANSGIGFETAKELAAQDYYVVMVCRNLNKAARSAQIITQQTGAAVDIMQADLASFASIHNFAQNYLNRYDRLDILINNAGLYSDSPQQTEDGYELTMGVNFLGTYLLTRLLLPALLKTEKSRIVNIASRAGFYGKINLAKPFHGPHGFRGYSASKLAQIWFTISLAEELKDKGILVNAVSPGRGATNIWRGESLMMKIVRPFMLRSAQSAAECAKTGLYVALAPEDEITTGLTFEKSKPLPYNQRCLDYQPRQQLMQLAQDIIQG
ncbi:SDR family NAD(P)-dependent oxidoreductase [Dethiobacter alkaliphilus]|uniref:Short-chain dehydrogenase/reductase SDR n=1 Tax=Dethiobacter alkaliphilus AHT 1 TaxID=555088 RepID=C0GHZ9_DETAL|nr:SDR family NAD(P)-dependent oxidoreductase [Dethiobacter alkaliphilus]EEG77073.1 short-chain dehydrogenase/reductase SDR [Dethiobacter alkaliphilus AHT 1]